MNEDGRVDYTRYSREDLLQVLDNIDGEKYPLNLQRAREQLALRFPNSPSVAPPERATTVDASASAGFVRSALAGREPLSRVVKYCAAFSFPIGFIGSLFNGGERGVRLVVFVVAGAFSLLGCTLLWRCADNSEANVGWFIRSSIVAAIVGMLLIAWLAWTLGLEVQ